VEAVRREKGTTAQQPTFGASVELLVDLPPEAGPTPMRIPEHPSLEAPFIERSKTIDDPHKYGMDFWNAMWEKYLQVWDIAKDFTDWMIEERIITEGDKDGMTNALLHFLASYSVTRETGNPTIAWNLGVINELLLSSPGAWRRGDPREKHRKDTEIDYYHNQLGIEEAMKSADKKVPLYELTKRLLREGKLRY
jgi:hypothetical protein